ncbi:DoxX family protein [Nonomuraea pusilla]|uniref:DoxX-like family protein n=1 Tax=Nonomuraea pusilla TaxID=46177 RepID=A0A1H7IDD0_9ACTN|nr:DoxX family protein [Nonomuraea pusilla]SEK59737.1 DoxX-like family protein [Nonomuraea pusilla]
MSIVLWVFQGLLAVLFLAAGALKLTRPADALTGLMPWVEDFTRLQIGAIGVLEVCGALGLVLPGITGIATWLTPLASAGLAVLMAGATVTHLMRGEAHLAWGNVLVLAAAAGVAWARLTSWPL